MELGEVIQGRLREITLNRIATELNGDHTLGETFLTVYDTSEFEDEGGSLEIEKLDGTLELYTYITKDDETSTVELSVGLTQAYDTDEKVFSYPPEYEKVAKVVPDGDSDWVEARVISGPDLQLTDDVYDGGDEKSVLIQLVATEGDEGSQGEWQLIEILSEEASIDGAVIREGTAPDPTVPIDTPDVSPPIHSVTGLATGIMVRIEEFSAQDQVEIHVSTTQGFTVTAGNTATLLAGTPTKTLIYIMTTLPNGTKPLPDTTYYFRVLAVNALGAAPAPSPEVSGALDPAAVMSLIAAELAVGFILTGRIQVGVAYIDADEGIVLPQPDGTVTRFTVDGTTPNQISGNAVLMALTLTEVASLYGTTIVYGEVKLASGVENPKDAPSLSTGWVTPLSTGLLAAGITGEVNGLTAKIGDATKFLTLHTDAGALACDVVEINKTTGVLTAPAAPAWAATMSGLGGITSDGTNYWVLGLRASDSWWVIHKLDSSFASLGSLAIFDNVDLPKIPAIGLVAGLPHVVYSRNGIGAIRVRKFTTADTPVLSAIYDPGTSATEWDFAFIGGETSANYADFGNPRILYGTQHNWNVVMAYNSNYTTKNTTYDFPMCTYLRGMYWDGTRFIHLDSSGKLWQYADDAPGSVTPTVVHVGYAWLDGNSTGGTHETMISPLRTITRLNRKQVIVTVPAPPEVALAGTDRANQVAVYAANDTSTVRYQATLGIGVYMLGLESINGASALPKAANEFETGGVAAPGYFRGGNGTIELSGSDAAQRMGPFEWDETNSADTGWVNFTATAGDSPFTSATVVFARYRRIGPFVMVQIQKVSTAAVNNGASTTGDFANVVVAGGLPAEVCPPFTVEVTARFDDTPITLALTTAGEFIRTGGFPRDWPSGNTLVGTACYMV